jgi:hypothetical protein
MSDPRDELGSAVNLRPAETGDVSGVRAIVSAAARDLTARFGQGHWSGVL